ncbi:hypothetical protein O181_012280 [Austropuccinia psidii MF-1]|uniref:Uncharacterized protein n=1 Tax=Austropuccinia psidii MF-1 TaxID=1389203 RepID=A0A9Q3BWT5_9BASI|nr:hypothetical protein [Austropuccinia psidii MF-1]
MFNWSLILLILSLRALIVPAELLSWSNTRDAPELPFFSRPFQYSGEENDSHHLPTTEGDKHNLHAATSHNHRLPSEPLFGTLDLFPQYPSSHNYQGGKNDLHPVTSHAEFPLPNKSLRTLNLFHQHPSSHSVQELPRRTLTLFPKDPSSLHDQDILSGNHNTQSLKFSHLHTKESCIPRVSNIAIETLSAKSVHEMYAEQPNLSKIRRERDFLQTSLRPLAGGADDGALVPACGSHVFFHESHYHDPNLVRSISIPFYSQPHKRQKMENSLRISNVPNQSLNLGSNYNNPYEFPMPTPYGAPQENQAKSSSQKGSKRKSPKVLEVQVTRVNPSKADPSKNALSARAKGGIGSVVPQNSIKTHEPFSFYPHEKVLAFISSISNKKPIHRLKLEWVSDLAHSIMELPNWKGSLEELKLFNFQQENGCLKTLADFLWELNARTLNVLGVGSGHDFFLMEQELLKNWFKEEVGKLLAPCDGAGQETTVDAECIKNYFSGFSHVKKKQRRWSVATKAKSFEDSNFTKVVDEWDLQKTKAIINIVGSYYKFHNFPKWNLLFVSDEDFLQKTLIYVRRKTLSHEAVAEPQVANSPLLSFFPWQTPELPEKVKENSGPPLKPLLIDELVFEIDERNQIIG